jgi:hypothetical protein
MPDSGASRKRQIAGRQIPGDLALGTTGLLGRPGYRVSFSTKSRSGSHGGAAAHGIRVLPPLLDHARVLFLQHPSKNIRLAAFGALPLYCAGRKLR